MIFFKANTKWYLKLLAWFIALGMAFIVFYIVGCQDLSFVAQNRVDCEAGPVDCDEERGLVVSPTLDEENMDCGSGETAGNGCFNVDGNDPENRNRDRDGGGDGDRNRDRDRDRGGDGDRNRDRDGNRNRDRDRDRDGDGDRNRDRDRDRDRNRRDRDSESERQPWMRIKTKAGKIDVLFIVDNSKSMTEELASIANQFDPFLNSIKDYDYHIALTTTDWIQDRGQFLVFGNGQKFLSNPDREPDTHAQNVQHFQDLVKMPPGTNDDERGIYALNMVLDNMNQSAFFRPHSLFMVIIISDEDERSFGGRVPEGFYGTVPPLESYDLPETFFRKVSHQHKFSIVTVHSIIMPPGGADCPNQCKAKSKCIEGRVYADLSRPSQSTLRQYGNIRRGHIGNICATDYSSQLGPIAESIQELPPLPLPCFPRSRVYAKVNGESVRFRVEEKKIILAEHVPFGSDVEVKFRCR